MVWGGEQMFGGGEKTLHAHSEKSFLNNFFLNKFLSVFALTTSSPVRIISSIGTQSSPRCFVSSVGSQTISAKSRSLGTQTLPASTPDVPR